jgi:hypothetical protein
VTGFFLHRHDPRQEIDIELTGDDPWRMLANVYFNPGDEGAAMAYGYRGSPCLRIPTIARRHSNLMPRSVPI